MIARMTIFTAQALNELVGEDNVLVISTELTNEALGLAEHAVCDVAGAEEQQISQLWRQTAAADSCEVVEREQVKVFAQMSRESVELIQNLLSQTARS